VHLIEGTLPGDRGQHFALQVADLEGIVTELRSAGFEVSDPSPVGTAGRRSSTIRPGNSWSSTSRVGLEERRVVLVALGRVGDPAGVVAAGRFAAYMARSAAWTSATAVVSPVGTTVMPRC